MPNHKKNWDRKFRSGKPKFGPVTVRKSRIGRTEITTETAAKLNRSGAQKTVSKAESLIRKTFMGQRYKSAGRPKFKTVQTKHRRKAAGLM